MSVRWPALLWFLLASTPLAQAQDVDREIAYYNRTSTGILAGGENGLVTGSLTTTHGISWRQWALGAGVGIEGYDRWRTMPIFGSLSYHFRGATETGIFMQLNVGHAICRLHNTSEITDVGGTRGGFMLSPVVGYQVAAGKFLVNFSAGYRMQKMRAAYQSSWSPLFYTMNEQADRFIFQIGVGF